MIHPAKSQYGSALLLAVIVVMMVAGLSAAFLSLAFSQSRTTFGATMSDMAFHTAEAGIDDTINKMNAYAQAVGKPNGVVPPGADFGVIAIVVTSPTGKGPVNLVAGNVNGGSYSVEISPPYAGRGIYTLSSTGTHQTSKRAIQTVVHPTNQGTAFSTGLFGDTGVVGSGGIFTDGYSSSKGTYASQAIHTANGKRYADPKGDVGTNQNIVISGNTTIFGNALPGTNGTLTESGGVMVMGATAPEKAPVVNPPFEYAPPTGLASEGNLKLSGGTTTLTSGTYRFDSISTSGSTTLALSGEVNLYLDGDLSVSGQSQIVLLPPPPAKVNIYQSSAGSIKVSGGGLVNQTMIPGNMMVYSASTTNADISGNSDFFGAVYAPQATFKPSGGSSFYGAFIAGNVQITGGATFHYDEDLGNQPNAIPVYKVLSWKEFTP
jgi:Tfp pilus assembly protein PilX